MEDEELNLEGVCVVQAKDLDGNVTFEERHNYIFKYPKGLLAASMWNPLGGGVGTGQPWGMYLYKLIIGVNNGGTCNSIATDDGTSSKGDGFGVPPTFATAAFTAGQLTYGYTVTPVAAGGFVTVVATIAAGEANTGVGSPYTINEAGLVYTPATGQYMLFSRVAHGGIVKTDTISITYTWTVNVT